MNQQDVEPAQKNSGSSPPSPFICNQSFTQETIFPRCHYSEFILLENKIDLQNSVAPLQNYSLASLQLSVLLQTSCFVSMSVTTIRRPLFLPHAFSPSQSFNDKRKKSFIFSRKFPFYKNKEQSEQETSDPERKQILKDNVTCNIREINSQATRRMQALPRHTPRQTTQQAGRAGLLL